MISTSKRFEATGKLASIEDKYVDESRRNLHRWSRNIEAEFQEAEAYRIAGGWRSSADRGLPNDVRVPE